MNISSLSTECESMTTIWTYYPCSFIVSSSISCPEVSINLSIDQCTNKELMFFWHFPSGNLTITLESDKNQPFLLRLFQISFIKRKLIRNIYHLINNQTIEKQILNGNDKDEEIIIPSNEFNQCSIKFQTSDQVICDYGTFLQMTILTTEN